MTGVASPVITSESVVLTIAPPSRDRGLSDVARLSESGVLNALTSWDEGRALYATGDPALRAVIAAFPWPPLPPCRWPGCADVDAQADLIPDPDGTLEADGQGRMSPVCYHRTCYDAKAAQMRHWLEVEAARVWEEQFVGMYRCHRALAWPILAVLLLGSLVAATVWGVRSSQAVGGCGLVSTWWTVKWVLLVSWAAVSGVIVVHMPKNAEIVQTLLCAHRGYHTGACDPWPLLPMAARLVQRLLNPLPWGLVFDDTYEIFAPETCRWPSCQRPITGVLASAYLALMLIHGMAWPIVGIAASWSAALSQACTDACATAATAAVASSPCAASITMARIWSIVDLCAICLVVPIGALECTLCEWDSDD